MDLSQPVPVQPDKVVYQDCPDPDSEAGDIVGALAALLWVVTIVAFCVAPAVVIYAWRVLL